jgi:hypothetical protein
MIRKTKIITFPRSGHHLLVRGILTALPEYAVYSEVYKSPHNMDNCEFVNLQKTHDFDLDEPINPDLQYIVQIRGFELAVESWHKLLVRNESYSGSFEDFRKEKTEYYDRFMEKWVNNPTFTNRLIIPYHELVADKKNTLINVIKYLGVTELTEDIIKNINEWESGSMRKQLYLS